MIRAWLRERRKRRAFAELSRRQDAMIIALREAVERMEAQR
jgi:hypothetical protein